MTDEQAFAHYRRYFDAFLPSILGKLMLEDLRGLSSCAEIEVSDVGDAPWRIAIECGRLAYVGHDGPEPTCRFRLDLATLIEVIAARTTPAEAFFDERIEIEGDVETGLKLSTVLEPFFRSFPFVG